MNDQLAAQHEALDQQEDVTTKLREQITLLRDELTEKNNSILALQNEIEELVRIILFVFYLYFIRTLCISYWLLFVRPK